MTDAHAVLGHFGDKRIARRKLCAGCPARASASMEKTRGTFRSVEEFAEGILAVANAVMEKAIRVISVERGHDPRDYTLVAFGGAGGLHACALASALEMRGVLLPIFPRRTVGTGNLARGRGDGVFAHGAVRGTRGAESVRSARNYADLFRSLETDGRSDAAAAKDFSPSKIRIEQRLDMRYTGASV